MFWSLQKAVSKRANKRTYARKRSINPEIEETLDLSKLKQVNKNVYIEEQPEEHIKAEYLKKSYGNREIDLLNVEYEKEVARRQNELSIDPNDAKTESSYPPMKDFEIPNFKVEPFNYKTFRYKDIMDSDFESVNESETLVGLEKKAESFTDGVMSIICDILKKEKGRDIAAINIEYKTNWVPRMIIVTADSARHCVALAKVLKQELKDLKLVRNARIERNEGDEWVVLSTGTIVVEIMTEASRDYMDIERLWVLKRSAQETFLFDQEEERFMYDEEDGMWDDDEEDM